MQSIKKPHLQPCKYSEDSIASAFPKSVCTYDGNKVAPGGRNKRVPSRLVVSPHRFWQYDASHDSIITVGNGGAKPAEAAFTINYNHGTGAYEIDQTLQPNQQMWIDVGQLIRDQVPDKNGTVLPASLTMGSYEIQQVGHHGPGTLFEGKVVYDKKYGSVTYGCAACCGYRQYDFELFIDPLDLPLYSWNFNQGVQGFDVCGAQWVDVTGDFYGSWSTQNHSVATVDASGDHYGAGVGSTTTDASAQEQIFNVLQDCPIDYVYLSGSDNVTPTASVSCTPQDLALGPTASSNTTTGSCTASVSPSGGSYSWSVNANTVTLNDPSSASPSFTAANASSSQGDTKISLTYTFNGQSATAQSAAITVQKPTSLSLASTTFNGASQCPSGYAGWERDVEWQVLDQFGQPMQIVGLPASDQISIGTPNSCGATTVQTGTGYTQPGGVFPGTYDVCSTACPAGCQTKATQTYTVAGIQLNQTITILYGCSSTTLNGE